MKKTTKLAVAAFCAVGAAGVLGGSSFAASNDVLIYYDYAASPKTGCSLTKASMSYPLCDASYGSYDASAKTLTLGSGLNSKMEVLVTGDDDLILKQSAKNVDLWSLQTSRNIAIDLGVSNVLKLTRNDSGRALNANDVIVNSGKIELNELGGSLHNTTINNGTIITGELGGEDVVINNGTITASNVNIGNDFVMKGGSLSINSNSVMGISVDGDMTIDGGYLNIVDKKTDRDGSGVNVRGGKFTINGGNISIDGFDWGISIWAGKAFFNGGTTILKNSASHLLWIMDAKDPKNDISFEKGMGIKEKNIVVFYDDSSTGIAVGDGSVGSMATITSGETYIRQEGWILNEGKEYEWTWFENWAKEEEWTEDVYNKNRGYVSCLLDNSFQIYNLTDYQAYHGLLKDKSKNKTLTADETKKKETCYAQYFKKSDDKKEQEGLIIEGSGEEKKDDKKDDKENGVPGGPEAGLFGENKAFAVAAAVTVAPVLGIAGYLAVAAKKRADRKVSFKKR